MVKKVEHKEVKAKEPKKRNYHYIPLIAVFAFLFAGVFAIGAYLGQNDNVGLFTLSTAKPIISTIPTISEINSANLTKIKTSTAISKNKFNIEDKFFKKVILDSNPSYDYSDKTKKYLVPYRLGLLESSYSGDETSTYCNAKFNIMTGDGNIIQEFSFSSDMGKQEFYKIPYMNLSMRCDLMNFYFRDENFNQLYTGVYAIENGVVHDKYNEVHIPILSSYQNGVCANTQNKYACDIVPYIVFEGGWGGSDTNREHFFNVKHIAGYSPSMGAEYLGPAYFADENNYAQGVYKLSNSVRNQKINQFSGYLELLNITPYIDDKGKMQQKLNINVYMKKLIVDTNN